MNKKSGKCNEIQRYCAECAESVSACFDHDEYFVCEECGCRMRIDKEAMKTQHEAIFRKIFGRKPVNPENN